MKTFLPTWFMPIRGENAKEFLHYISLNLSGAVWKRTMSSYLVHMQLFQILKYKFFFLDDVKK